MGHTQHTHADVMAGSTEFHIAVTTDAYDSLQRILSPTEGPNASEHERGVYCVITRSTGRTRVTYLIREVVKPEDGEVQFGSNGLNFDTDYRHRATRRAATVDGGGLLIIHTHPRGQARPSDGDLKADPKDLYDAAQRLDPGVPLAAGIYSEANSWHIRAYDMEVARHPAHYDGAEYGPETATWRPATAIRVVGERFQKVRTTTTDELSGPAGVRGPIDEELVESSRHLWSTVGQERVAGLRVGVIGCGGGGSILAEMLPRLGVGQVVLVDFDRLERANANRAVGATPVDIKENRLKVRVSARVAERSAVAEQFSVRPVVGSVVESENEAYDPLEHLLDCDILMNAADPHWVRKVVDDISQAHLIPVIDGGSDLDTNDQDQLTGDAQSNVTVGGPGHPCLECASMWKAPKVSKNKAGVEGDPYTDDARAPSVISMNGLVESLATQRLQNLVLGVAPDATVGAMRYRPAAGELEWREVKLDGRLTECRADCDRPTRTALGDAINDDLDRYRDPFLSEHLENGLSASGVVDPAPHDYRPESATDADDGPGLISALWNRIAGVLG